MRCYQLRDASGAAAVMTAARDCPVPEIACLGRTLHTWRAEFLAHFAHTDVSNGPTESLNLKIKNTKRTARGFRNFGNYRLRLLLNHGRIQNNHQTSRIRTRVSDYRIEFRLLGTGIHTGGVIASVPTLNAETSLCRESGQYRQTTDHCQSATVPAASCTATATASLRAEPSITVTAIITARCRCFSIRPAREPTSGRSPD